MIVKKTYQEIQHVDTSVIIKLLAGLETQRHTHDIFTEGKPVRRHLVHVVILRKLRKMPSHIVISDTLPELRDRNSIRLRVIASNTSVFIILCKRCQIA